MSAPIPAFGQPLGETTVNAPGWFREYDEGEVLLPYQRAWVADPAPLKIAEKSRRTGLTWAEAADAALTAGAARSAGGCNHFYIGSNKEMAQEFIEAVAMWALAFHQAAGEIREEVIADEDRDILTYVVRFASGFKVQALSSNPKNLRGMQGNVTIDEAAFHERLAEVLKAALALTMWGAKVRLISTHNGVDNLFAELINDSRAGRKDYSVHRITLDDACAQGLYRRICQITRQPWTPEREADWVKGLLKNTASTEDAQEEYYCVPKRGGGAYLSRALVEARMVPAPVLRYTGSAEFNTWPEHLREAEIRDWCARHLLPLLEQLDPARRHALGEDFARSGDLTVLAPMAVETNLVRRVPFIVELRNVPFRQQEQILYYLCDRLPRLCKAKLDARGNGQYLAEQARFRYGADTVDEVMLSQGWYLEHMPKFRAAFEDGLIEIPRDDAVAGDLRAIQVVRGIPRIPDGNTQSQGEQRHGDAAVALCLAYAASFEDAVVLDFTPAPRAAGRWQAPGSDTDHPAAAGRGAW
ncbi:MAG: terminase large subunit domain-containing protein [Pseudomonadota bacterium]